MIRWLPEIILIASSLVFAAFALLTRHFIKRAVTYQYFRFAGLAILSVAPLMEGMRLALTSLTPIGDLLVGVSVFLSALVMGRVYGEAQQRLQDSRRSGQLAEELNEQRWDWSGQLFTNLGASIEFREKRTASGRSTLWRLHWLVPAAGIMVGRYFAHDVAVLLTGAVFLFAGLLLLQGPMKELALARQLVRWEEERGDSLRLRAASG